MRLKFPKRLISIISILLSGVLLAEAGRRLAVWHVNHQTGRNDLQFVSCHHCHLVRKEWLPWTRKKTPHASPADIVASLDSRHIYVAMYEMDEVWEIDLSSRQVKRKTSVPGRPTALALDSANRFLYVACRGTDRVTAISLDTFKLGEWVEVGVEPVALAACQTPSGPRLIVANQGSDDISVLSLNPLREICRPIAGRQPSAVVCAPDGSQAWIANRLAIPTKPIGYDRMMQVHSCEITVLEPAQGRILRRTQLQSAHLSEGAAYYPENQWALVPFVKVQNLVPITQVAQGWVMSSGLAVETAAGSVIQIPLDEANNYYADPSGIAVDAVNHRAFIVSGGSDAITVVDLDKLSKWLEQASEQQREQAIEDLSLSGEYVTCRIPTARNPKRLALTPDNSLLLVAERLNDTILIIDTRSCQPLGRIVLGDGGLKDPIRRGERVFTDARYTFQNQFSCRSCHPDGHVDGLSYDFDSDGIGDNLVDNRSLLGVAFSGPFKWTGKNPSLEVQCGPRFAKVLMRTDPIPPSQLKDLTSYLKSLSPARVVAQKGPLTPAQERGRQIFFATHTPDGTPIPRYNRCSTCHRPPLYSNRLMANVGSRGPRDSTDYFDTPHLLGIGASAPYLHDGRAATLEELWTVYNTNDVHGVSSYMNKIQLNDLIEFLKTL